MRGTWAALGASVLLMISGPASAQDTVEAAYRAALAEHQRQLEARGNKVP